MHLDPDSAMAASDGTPEETETSNLYSRNGKVTGGNRLGVHDNDSGESCCRVAR